MTAINILPLDGAVYLFGDGASYSADGVLQAVTSKVHIMAGISAAMMCAGRSIIVPYLAHYLARDVEDFDDLRAMIEGRLPGLESSLAELFGADDHSPTAGANGYRLFFAGWSPRYNRPDAFCISNSIKDAANPPHTVIDASRGKMAPGVTAAECALGYGGSPIITPETIENVALTTLELQRHQLEPDGSSRVGGHVEFVTVRRDRVEVRIIKRYAEDEIGKLMKPAPIDWAAWRRDHPVNHPTAAMSLLKRDAWERKQRKAKRRAA